jgi:hypothetical protein
VEDFGLEGREGGRTLDFGLIAQGLAEVSTVLQL